MAETDVLGGVEIPKESVVDVLDQASLQNGNNTGSVLVETCLQEILEYEVSDLAEVSVNHSNVPPGPITQDPDSGGKVNENNTQSQALVAVISDSMMRLPTINLIVQRKRIHYWRIIS